MQQAAGDRDVALRSEDAGGCDQRRISGKCLLHRAERLGFEQGVGVYGEHQFRFDDAAGDVQRVSLAAMGKAQPAKRRVERARRAQLAHRRGDQAVMAAQQGGGAVAGAVVGDEDVHGRADLSQQGAQGLRQDALLVVGRDNDGGGREEGGGGWLRAVEQGQGLPEDEHQEHRVVTDIRQAGGPGEQTAAAEGPDEQQRPEQQRAAMDQPAPQGGGRRSIPGGDDRPLRRQVLFNQLGSHTLSST